MKKLIILFSFIFIIAISKSQSQNWMPDSVPTLFYGKMIFKGDSAFKKGNFNLAAKDYRMALYDSSTSKYLSDKFRLANTYALLNKPDSAFKIIFEYARTGYLTNDFLKQDEYLNSLHNDTRWLKVFSLVDTVKHKGTSKKKFLKLSNSIDSLAFYDQKWRDAQPNDTLTQKEIDHKIIKTDSLDYLFLKKIVAKYGCPNILMVGGRSAMNFWLLVQHQDMHLKFQKKVLKLMKIQIEKKHFNPKYYAYLIDRVRINSGQKQVYGTQLELNKQGTAFVPKPCITPTQLNYRRFQMNFQITEQEYLNNAASDLAPEKKESKK